MSMDNFIGRDGNHFDAYWIIHGTPQGSENNAAPNDPVMFVSYADFHKARDTHISSPSKPGEKFIKEEIQGAVAYTFVRTGIKQITSGRDGSNYGAITVIMDDINDSDSKKFEQELKKWFYKNVLDKFTYPQDKDGWLKWNVDARDLFNGAYDKQLKDSIHSVIRPYLTVSAQKNNNADNAEKLNSGTQRLKEEIAKLERAKRDIEQQLAQKYAELENYN